MKKMGEKAKIISCLAIIIVSLIIIFALKAGDGDGENEIKETKKKVVENETTTKKTIDNKENETTTKKTIDDNDKEANETTTKKMIDDKENETTTNKTSDNSENDITKDVVENETTTNKTNDYKDIFIPDIAEKDIIKKSLDISKSTTDDEIIAIFGNNYTVEIINEEHNFKKIEWSGIEVKNNVYIKLKDNKCYYKNISIGLGNGITKRTEITEELYYKLKINSTYDDVKDILGEGTLSSVNISGWDDYGNQEINYTYIWGNENDLGTLIISFDRNLKFKRISRSMGFKFYE